MATINVSDATGVVLDWLVAKCEGAPTEIIPADGQLGAFWIGKGDNARAYSTKWAAGGPIIDELLRSGLNITQGGPLAANDRVWVYRKETNRFYHGATLLIAAMRCYVASKLGDTVEVPDELLAA